MGQVQAPELAAPLGELSVLKCQGRACVWAHQAFNKKTLLATTTLLLVMPTADVLWPE